jgi:hypothetical protein
MVLDILGYKSGPSTRANQPRKAWALMVVCHLTSAVNFEWLESYCTEALMAGLLAHEYNTRIPALVTGDAGSQIKSAARRITRSATAESSQTPDTSKSEKSGEWAKMLDTIKQKFKGQVWWYIAPPHSQSWNGQMEGNVHVAKGRLKSHLKVLNMKNFLFPSQTEMSHSFTRTKHLLNTRPLFYSESDVITVQDILFPRVLMDENQSAVSGISQLVDEAYTSFVELHRQSVVNGHYTRFGSKVQTRKKQLKPNDFIIVCMADKPKYDIVEKLESEHRITVRLLVRRYKDGTGKVGKMVVGVDRIVHLFTPPNI